MSNWVHFSMSNKIRFVFWFVGWIVLTQSMNHRTKSQPCFLHSSLVSCINEFIYYVHDWTVLIKQLTEETLKQTWQKLQRYINTLAIKWDQHCSHVSLAPQFHRCESNWFYFSTEHSKLSLDVGLSTSQICSAGEGNLRLSRCMLKHDRTCDVIA